MAGGGKHSLFWPVLLVVVGLDLVTKQLAVAHLGRVPVRVLGDWLALRLVYNPGAAFGLYAGEHSRWIFMGLALIALVVLGMMVWHTPPAQRIKLTALALVCGGAVGNLIDRVRSPRGVVDFIDVWIGTFHWPTFNVADMAVSCGAIVLAAVLWREGKEHEHAAGRTDPAEASS